MVGFIGSAPFMFSSSRTMPKMDSATIATSSWFHLNKHTPSFYSKHKKKNIFSLLENSFWNYFQKDGHTKAVKTWKTSTTLKSFSGRFQRNFCLLSVFLNILVSTFLCLQKIVWVLPFKLCCFNGFVNNFSAFVLTKKSWTL